MRILITGASGFIGRNLSEWLERKYDIYAPTHSNLDLLDEFSVFDYIKDCKIDVVIHCANTNNVSYDLSDYDILNNGLKMFYSLEKSSYLFKKMIYFGSGAEYSMKQYIPKMRESYFGNYIPEDPYGFAKYIMSRETDKDNNIYDLRLFGVYGKYEQWERRFLSNNIVRSLKGLPMTLSKNAYFDYLYIDDLCKIVEWFIENEPQHKHYNVCTSQAVDLLTLAHMINDISGLDRKIVVKEKGWKLEYSGDNSRLLNEMNGFEFADKRQTIKEMWEYYEKHIDEIDERRLLL